MIAILSAALVSFSHTEVAGKAVDSFLNPIKNAQIKTTRSRDSTLTDADGNWRISSPTLNRPEPILSFIRSSPDTIYFLATSPSNHPIQVVNILGQMVGHIDGWRAGENASRIHTGSALTPKWVIDDGAAKPIPHLRNSAVSMTCQERRIIDSAILSLDTEKIATFPIWESNSPSTLTVLGSGWNNSIPYDLFVDPRDGMLYPIVTVGNLNWFAINLNHKTDSSWCYSDDTANCKLYGRLYKLFNQDNCNNNACRSSTTLHSPDLCPLGWRIPTDEDWSRSILNSINCSNSKYGFASLWRSKQSWTQDSGGIDAFGLRLLPGGTRTPNGTFYDRGVVAGYWTASSLDTGATLAVYVSTMMSSPNVIGESNNRALSIRCIREAP